MNYCRMSKRCCPLRAALILVIASGLVADFASAQPAPPAVLVAAAEMRDVSGAAEFVGRVKAIEKVDLRARVAGFLGPWLFQEGDRVKAGQTVFTLDAAPFEATLAQRKAEVASAAATLDYADLQTRRGRELIKTKTIPQQELDQRESTLLKARASLEQAQAAQRSAEVDLSYTQIKSPIDGPHRPGRVLARKSRRPQQRGARDRRSSRTPIQVVFNVSQRQLQEERHVAPKEQLDAIVARLRLADGSTYGEPGKLDFIGLQADPNTDSIPLRAVFPNPKGFLADGMSVRVLLEIGKPMQALVIPQSAIAQDQAGTYVFVVDAQNKAIQRPVKVEMQRDGTAVVKDGLAAGDRVIVQGQARVRPGLTVAPSNAPPA